MADSDAATQFVHGLDYLTFSNGTSESNNYLANSLPNIQNTLHFKDPNQTAKIWSSDNKNPNPNPTFSEGTNNCAPKILQPVLPFLSEQLGERSWNRSFSSAFHQVKRKGTLEDTFDMHPGYSYDPSTKTSTPCSFVEPTVKMSQNFPSWGDVQDLIEASNQQTDSDSKKNKKCNGGKKRRAKSEVKIKDDKYWEKRKKNNIAAKRSRDAKREKELTKQKRAMLLQIENTRLRLELSWLQEQNKNFKQRIVQTTSS